MQIYSIVGLWIKISYTCRSVIWYLSYCKMNQKTQIIAQMANLESETLLSTSSPTTPILPSAPTLLEKDGSQEHPVVYDTFDFRKQVLQRSYTRKSRASTMDSSQPDERIPLLPDGTNVDEDRRSKPEKTLQLSKAYRYRNEIISSVLCCFGNMAHGLAYGFASPAVPALIFDQILYLEQASLFESLLTVGALLGGLTVGLLVGKLGRKGTLLLSGLPFLAGWTCLAILKWNILLFVGRLLTGFGYGLVAVVGPLYIVETVSPEIRGALTMGVTLASSSGILLQFCMGLALDTRWMAIASMVPVIIMIIGMIFMPESPRWLMSRGRYDKAMDALIWLRRGSKQDVHEEYQQIADNINSMDNGIGCNCGCSLEDLKSALKPILICSTLFVFQQMCGTTPIIFNAQEIFFAVGFKNPNLQTGQIPAIIIAAVKMATTLIGIYYIDKVGRRPLFISCGFIMGISCIVAGLYFEFRSTLVAHYTWLPLLALIIYEAAFSVAWGGIPWLLLSEMPPLQFRGIAAVTGSVATRITSIIITQEFYDLIWSIHFSGTFWLFGAVSIAGSLFAWKFMPETNQRSLEHIEQDLTLSIHQDLTLSIHILTDSIA